MPTLDIGRCDVNSTQRTKITRSNTEPFELFNAGPQVVFLDSYPQNTAPVPVDPRYSLPLQIGERIRIPRSDVNDYTVLWASTAPSPDGPTGSQLITIGTRG